MLGKNSYQKNKGYNGSSIIGVTLLVGAVLLLILSITPAKSESVSVIRGTADHVVINEVFYDSPGTEPDEEWIEIYNPTSTPVNISGWYLTDDPSYESPGGEGSYRFPNGTIIQADSFIVVAYNGTAFYAKYNFYPDFEFVNTTSSVPDMVVVSTGIALGNSGDDIHLFDSSGVEIDVVWYGSCGDLDYAPYNQTAAPDVAAGHSIGRNPDGNDTDNCTADFADYANPTPGDYNTTVTEIRTGDVFIATIFLIAGIIVYEKRRKYL